ncbi:hypothetical protein PYCC9005_003353 [Savitreella phatthalungensis]
MFRTSITRAFSTTRLTRKSLPDAAKETLENLNKAAGKAALSGVEAVDAAAEAVKSATVGAGAESKIDGKKDELVGKAKQAAGVAQDKAEELKRKI